MSIQVQQAMTRLRRAILSMSASSTQRIHEAIDALITMDEATAKRIRDADVEIDRMEVDIDVECTRILAQYAPVAADLRFVLAALRIDRDLERIGDMAKTIAKRTVDLAGRPPVDLPVEFTEMATAATAMLKNVGRALADNNAELAQQVRDSDDFVDELYRRLIAWGISRLEAHDADAQAIVDIISVTRSIERIADHCTAIAEDIIFCVRGDIVRHERIH